MRSIVPEGLSYRNVLGILALFCTMGEFTILTPSIAAFSHHFVDTSITTIMFANSITGIVSVPLSWVSGALLHRVGFRPIGIAGIAIMSLGGAFPFLLPHISNYLFIIVSRIIVGVGLGFMFPVGNASIVAFTEEGWLRSKLLGLGAAVQFVFSLIYTTVAGFLTEIAWNYSFLTYLIGLVPLVVVALWMPEGKSIVAARKRIDEAMDRTSVSKEKIPRAVWGYALLSLVGWTCVVTVQVVTSTVLDERGMASPAEAAMVINCCGIGSIICGLLFPRLVRLFKSRLFGIAYALIALGLIPCLLARSPVVYALGVLILGFGGSSLLTGAQNAAGNISPRTRVPFVSGFMSSMMSLGPFIGPYVYAASVVFLPSAGNAAVYYVLLAASIATMVVSFALPLRALTKSKNR